MTRDQAEKIAKAVMDEIEHSRMISRDRLTDAIFNCWHKATAEQYRVSYISASYEGMRRAAIDLGLDPAGLICSPEELRAMRELSMRPMEYIKTTSTNVTALPIDMQLDD